MKGRPQCLQGRPQDARVELETSEKHRYGSNIDILKKGHIFCGRFQSPHWSNLHCLMITRSLIHAFDTYGGWLRNPGPVDRW